MKKSEKRMGNIPESGMFNQPSWWHHHGSKMALVRFDKDFHSMLISASTADLKIIKRLQIEESWQVDWRIQLSAESKVEGRVIFTTMDLQAAFGLIDYTSRFGTSILGEYGGDSAYQGKYIRWGNFLNIPCPGTGHDGDPNISILINEAMKKAVRSMV